MTYSKIKNSINTDIKNQQSNDSFDLSKRVKTLKESNLRESIEKLDLVDSRGNLISKNVKMSKIYLELEGQHTKLKTDFEELSKINKDLIAQLDQLSKEKQEAISDT